MSRNRIIMWVGVGIVVIAGSLVLTFSLMTYPIQPASKTSADAVLSLLDQVTNRDKHVASATDEGSLLAPNARVFQTLAEEIEQVGKARALNPDDPDMWQQRSERVREAFQIATNNAAPLVPFLQTNFLSGQNPGDSSWALLYVGPEGWPTIIAGLSNQNFTVQSCSAALVGLLPQDCLTNAIPSLLSVLTNGTVIARVVAADSLRQLDTTRNEVVSALAGRLRHDPAWEVRMKAAQALGSFAADSYEARQTLDDASTDDHAEVVRKAATEALRRREQ